MMSKEEHKAAMMGLCIAHITSPAENRMRTRTAIEQLERAKAKLNAEQGSTDDHRETDAKHPGD